MFEAFYDSVWQQPVLLVVVPLASLWFLPRRAGFASLWLWCVTIETVLDAVLTSSLVRLPSQLVIAFVVLGDLRWFALSERYSQAEPGRGWLLRSIAGAAPVPLLQAALIALFPELFENPRYTFLAYECLFVLWLSLYRVFVLGRRPLTAQRREFLAQLSNYALGYYALWALADLWILAGGDGGYLLRVVPNLLYYSLFVPFVRTILPAEEP